MSDNDDNQVNGAGTVSPHPLPPRRAVGGTSCPPAAPGVAPAGKYGAPQGRDVLVFLSAPLGSGDVVPGNVARAVAAGDDLMALHPRLLVYVPHAQGHTWDAHRHHDYEWWMAHCLGMVRCSRAVVRLPGHSPGADRETAYALSLGIPVFRAPGDLLAWLQAIEDDQ